MTFLDGEARSKTIKINESKELDDVQVKERERYSRKREADRLTYDREKKNAQENTNLSFFHIIPFHTS